jgi:hypothetical protein
LAVKYVWLDNVRENKKLKERNERNERSERSDWNVNIK